MTTESNKIIAEFMGWELKHNPNISQKTWNNKEKGYCKYKESTFIEYSNDWNWLMEVVEKIKKETNEDEFLSRLTTRETRKAIDLESTLENCFRKSYLSIESVYNSCIEFIKWYNEQK